MLRGYKTKSKDGVYLSVCETEKPDTLSLVIYSGSGNSPHIEMSREEWIELCDLKYDLKFVKEESNG